MPLYAYQQHAHAQEDGADSEVYAEEFSALRGAVRNEAAGDHQRARGAREERRAEIDEPEGDDHGSGRRAAARAETSAAAAVLAGGQRHFGWLSTSSTLTTRSRVLVNWTH